MGDDKFYSFIENCESEYRGYEKDSQKAIEYAHNLTYSYEATKKYELQLIEKKLQKLYYIHKKEVIGNYYAELLGRLSKKQDILEIRESIKKIRELYNRNINSTIGLYYCVILKKCSNFEGEITSELLVKRLDAIYNNHRNEEIAYVYLKSLATIKSSDISVLTFGIIKKAYKIYNDFPTIRLATCYTDILRNYITTVDKSRNYYNEILHLKTIYKKFPVEKIAINYIYFLAQLSYVCDGENDEELCKVAVKLYKDHKSLVTASCLSYIILNKIKNNKEDSLKNLEILEKLYNAYPLEEFANNYMLGLKYIDTLSFNEKIEENIEKANKIYLKIETKTIAESYSGFLRKAVLQCKKLELIYIIEELQKTYKSTKIDINTMSILVYLINTFDEEDCKKVLEKAEDVYSENKDIEIVNFYMKTMSAFYTKYESDIDKYINEMIGLCKEDRVDFDKSLCLDYLIETCRKTSFTSKMKILLTLEKYYKVTKQYDAVIKYLEALLIVVKEEDVNFNVNKKFEKLYKKYKTHDIAKLYAKLIFHQSKRKDKRDFKKAIKQITNLYKKHTNADIKKYYLETMKNINGAI